MLRSPNTLGIATLAPAVSHQAVPFSVIVRTDTKLPRRGCGSRHVAAARTPPRRMQACPRRVSTATTVLHGW
jgi:hypothetical protein